MPTNQEWLHKLANESPDELKAWFDAEHFECPSDGGEASIMSVDAFIAEHNDNLAAEKVVSGDAAHSNDEKADTREQLATWAAFAQTHEGELLNEVRVKQAISDSLSEELEELREAFNEICKCAHVPTDWKPIFAAGAVTGTIEGAQKLVRELKEQVDRLTAERDNLAKDLNDMMRSMDKLCDRFRDASSSALDNAHEIQRIIDNFWTV